MIKVYTEILPDVPYIPLLYPNLGVQRRDTILFLNNAFKEMEEPFVEVVENIDEADYVLLAHNYSALGSHESYIDKMAELSERHGKKLIVFWHGDSDDPVPIEDAIVFRTSQYGYKKQENEIMMPSYAEDLLGDRRLVIRSKSKKKPVVGFCGWANYKNLKNRIGTFINNFNAPRPVHRKGLTFRMQAIEIFQKSDCVNPNFLVRSSYSGHSSTIKMSAKQAREEYIDNMLNSDFALVIKGDGNYSYRFYEALSLGRVPLLLNTDYVLPLSDIIDYDKFIISVDHTDLPRIDQILREHWDRMDSVEFEGMQRKAREVYRKYLSVKSFLRYAVEHLL